MVPSSLLKFMLLLQLALLELFIVFSIEDAPLSTGSLLSAVASSSGNVEEELSVPRSGLKGDHFFDNGLEEDWKISEAFSQYPFTLKDFHRSYEPAWQTNCAFAGLVQRLDRGEAIKLVVYGTSVSYGSTCESKTWGRDQSCSWVNRVRQWLAYQFPRWNITLENKSRGGWGVINCTLSQKKLL
jgi:hypothetical protein